jgi:hypothetical protein
MLEPFDSALRAYPDVMANLMDDVRLADSEIAERLLPSAVNFDYTRIANWVRAALSARYL